jgi:hypothetical protein
MRVLGRYFESTGSVTASNAWEHVYRCLLWMNEPAGLAHIYDSNHMQAGGNFHSRAVRFTESLCAHWHTDKQGLGSQLDVLFRGCVAELRRRTAEAAQNDADASVEAEIVSDLIAEIASLLQQEGLPAGRASTLARRIELRSRDFFTIGNKRKNALGEGFEDLLTLLLERVSGIPQERFALRRPVSSLPGFRPAAPQRTGQRREREPRPDIALTVDGVTHVIGTAKWSIRQDRETQFASEYAAYQRNKVQPTEIIYCLITNEFDLARLRNIARAMPGAAGGYIFHKIYHISLDMLRIAHGEKFTDIEPWVQTGQIQSLADFLEDMQGRFGT